MKEPPRAAVLGFSALTRLAKAHVLSPVNLLAHPKGEAWTLDQRAGSGPQAGHRGIRAALPALGMQRRSILPCLLR